MNKRAKYHRYKERQRQRKEKKAEVRQKQRETVTKTEINIDTDLIKRQSVQHQGKEINHQSHNHNERG